MVLVFAVMHLYNFEKLFVYIPYLYIVLKSGTEKLDGRVDDISVFLPFVLFFFPFFLLIKGNIEGTIFFRSFC